MQAARRILSVRLLGEESGACRRVIPGAPKMAATCFLVNRRALRLLSKKGGVASMQLTEKHKEYWQKNLKITSILFVIWFFFTFVTGWFSRELNEITFIGPLGFWFAAQGSLAIYVAVIVYYARTMNRLDDEYGVQEVEE
jgi:putative solute:sodium symporter small subunit